MSISSRRTFLAALSARLWPAQYVPSNPDRPEPATGDEPGFRPDVRRQDLDGWEGDPKYWRVENGALVGEITPETVIKSNTFIIWKRRRSRRFRAEGRLPHHACRQQRHQLSQRGGAGPGYARQQVRHARVPVRYRWGRTAIRGRTTKRRAACFMRCEGQVTHVVGGQKPILLSAIGDTGGLRRSSSRRIGTRSI